MNNFELEIEELKKKIEILENEKKTDIKSYSFSKIRTSELNELVDIERVNSQAIFKDWFNYSYTLKRGDTQFLKHIIEKVNLFTKEYNEEELKVKFIAPILNRVDFELIDDNVRDYYNTKLSYKTDKFIFTGEADFFVGQGLWSSKKTYFFIQEFKRELEFSNPEPQLLAELISAIELNKQNSIRGAYIVGTTWNFVVLEKLGDNKYRYFVSPNFYGTKLDDLKRIYKILQFVKNEIIKEVRS